MSYTKTRHDLRTFLDMDGFWSDHTPVQDLIDALAANNWQVQQAALLALGDRAATNAVPAILQLLDDQDHLDVYGAPNVWDLDGSADTATTEIWRCRYRVKQAACRALAAIVAVHASDTLGPEALRRLEHYAVSQDDDYPVRVAACEALAQIADPHSRNVLKQAAADGEWCTKTTAAKALKRITTK